MNNYSHSILPYLDKSTYNSFDLLIEDFLSCFKSLTKYSESNSFNLKKLNLNKKFNFVSDEHIDVIQNKFFLKLLYADFNIKPYKELIESFYLNHFSNKNYIINVHKSSSTIYLTTLIAIVLDSNLIFNDIIPYYKKNKNATFTTTCFFTFFIMDHTEIFISLEKYIIQTKKAKFLINILTIEDFEIIKTFTKSKYNSDSFISKLFEKQKNYWLTYDNLENF